MSRRDLQTGAEKWKSSFWEKGKKRQLNLNIMETQSVQFLFKNDLFPKCAFTSNIFKQPQWLFHFIVPLFITKYLSVTQDKLGKASHVFGYWARAVANYAKFKLFFKCGKKCNIRTVITCSNSKFTVHKRNRLSEVVCLVIQQKGL